MRRKDREVTDMEDILKIVDKCSICRIGMADTNGQPYIVPLNFGYKSDDNGLTLFFHSAPEGHKLDIMHANSKVCVEMDYGHKLVEHEKICDYGYAYECVIGQGEVEFITDNDEKIEAMTLLVKHSTGKDCSFTADMLSKLAIYKITLKTLSCKTANS